MYVHQALLATAVALRPQTGLTPAGGEPQWPGGGMGSPCTFPRTPVIQACRCWPGRDDPGCTVPPYWCRQDSAASAAEQGVVLRGSEPWFVIALSSRITCLEDQANVSGMVLDVGFICLLTRCGSGLAGMVATRDSYRRGQRSVRAQRALATPRLRGRALPARARR